MPIEEPRVDAQRIVRPHPFTKAPPSAAATTTTRACMCNRSNRHILAYQFLVIPQSRVPPHFNRTSKTPPRAAAAVRRTPGLAIEIQPESRLGDVIVGGLSLPPTAPGFSLSTFSHLSAVLIWIRAQSRTSVKGDTSHRSLFPF